MLSGIIASPFFTQNKAGELKFSAKRTAITTLVVGLLGAGYWQRATLWAHAQPAATGMKNRSIELFKNGKNAILERLQRGSAAPAPKLVPVAKPAPVVTKPTRVTPKPTPVVKKPVALPEFKITLDAKLARGTRPAATQVLEQVRDQIKAGGASNKLYEVAIGRKKVRIRLLLNDGQKVRVGNVSMSANYIAADGQPTALMDAMIKEIQAMGEHYGVKGWFVNTGLVNGKRPIELLARWKPKA